MYRLGESPNQLLSMDNELAALEAAASEADSGVPTPAPEAPPQQQEGEQPEPAPEGEKKASEESQVETEEAPPEKEETIKVSAYTRKKAEKAEKSKQDAEWKKIRLKQEELAKREADIAEKAKQNEPTPEAYEDLAKTLEYSDPQKAELARQEAQRLRQAQAQSSQETEWAKKFATYPRELTAPEMDLWRANEQEIAKHNPDFNPETGSPLSKAVQTILEDKEFGPLYRSSPFGIWAAYDRAQLHVTVDYLNLALNKISEYEGEIKKLKESLGSVSSSPKSAKSQSLTDMNEKDALEHLYREAAKIDGA